MSQRTIKGSKELSAAIISRRKELKMTIKEAATRAGVGIKTWCRYESGESIRHDKCANVCKALNWKFLPVPDADNDIGLTFDIASYKKDKLWSSHLEKEYGETAALSFLVGSDTLSDYIDEDLAKLKTKPQGSHVGQIPESWLSEMLPQQFLIKYDYEFIYAMGSTLNAMRSIVEHSGELVAHSVLEELILYLVVQASRMVIELGEYTTDPDWDKWIFEMFGDMDLITALYTHRRANPDSPYYFAHWTEALFFM